VKGRPPNIPFICTEERMVSVLKKFGRIRVQVVFQIRDPHEKRYHKFNVLPGGRITFETKTIGKARGLVKKLQEVLKEEAIEYTTNTTEDQNPEANRV
jgi:hypothetical protein